MKLSDYFELKSIEEERLLIYLDLLLRWNEKIDLISPDYKNVLIENHLIDSLLANDLISKNFATHGKLVDIGSGAGLPGIVLSIMNPDRPTYLLEPRDKRAHFVKEVKRELKLPNLQMLKNRMEHLPNSGI